MKKVLLPAALLGLLLTSCSAPPALVPEGGAGSVTQGVGSSRSLLSPDTSGSAESGEETVGDPSHSLEKEEAAPAAATTVKEEAPQEEAPVVAEEPAPAVAPAALERREEAPAAPAPVKAAPAQAAPAAPAQEQWAVGGSTSSRWTQGVLNLRSGPGKNFGVLTALSPSVELRPTGVHTSEWVQVDTPSGQGWVLLALTAAQKPVPAPAPAAKPAAQPPAQPAAPAKPAAPAAPAAPAGILWSDSIVGTLSDITRVPCGGLWRYPGMPNFLARERACAGSDRYLGLKNGDRVSLGGQACTVVGKQYLNYHLNSRLDIVWYGNTIVQTCTDNAGNVVEISFNCS